MAQRGTLEERLYRRVDKHAGFPDFSDPLVRVTEADGECWLWSGATVNGYGVIQRRTETGSWRQDYVHRVALELRGIDPGASVDHLCRRRNCVRHIESLADHRENVLRGNGGAGANARKTHCVHGHEFTPGNTRIKIRRDGGESRQCRACDRDRTLARRKSDRINNGGK